MSLNVQMGSRFFHIDPRYLFFLIWIPISWAHGEKVGELRVEDLTIRPTFKLVEPKKAQFQVGDSSAAFRFRLNESINALVRVGPKSLMAPMARYSDSTSDELGLVEAFAEIDATYGRVRAGLLPLEFGSEGALKEGQLYFPRSYLFSKRVVPLRDVGFSYSIENRGFFTEIIVHNGEGFENSDGRVWYTGKWGWSNDQNVRVGIAGLTGSTLPIVTSSSNDTLAGVDTSNEAQWRLAGLFFDYQGLKLKSQLEGYVGELVQRREAKGYASGHWDLRWEFTKQFGSQVRYDFYDPHLKTSRDLEQSVSLGFRLSDSLARSNIYFVGKKVLEEKGQIPNDEFYLIWSLSPYPTTTPTAVDLITE